MKAPEPPTVLIVDDEEGPRSSLRMILGDRCVCAEAASGEEALRRLRDESVDIVLLDIMLQDVDGLDLLRDIRAVDPDATVIMITAVRSTRAAVRAMQLGAYDYLTKPFDPEEIRITVHRAAEAASNRRELSRLRLAVAPGDPFHSILGDSPAMNRVFRTIQQVMGTDSTVLIAGESGTGKELVARALHFNGARADGPFVPVDCAAVSRDLLESELFGHVRGAFTGAMADRKGMFQVASGGTLFLDEIGEMPLAMQVKLLRAIQEREVRPVGATKSTTIDVRLIAATNRRLAEEVAAGSFREDLYYRINVVPIELPPLRDRRGDVPVLLDHFLRGISERLGIEAPALEPGLLDALEAYAWPGNVRQLENTVERMLVLSGGEEPLGIEHLPAAIAGNGVRAAAVNLDADDPRAGVAQTITVHLDDSAPLGELTRRVEAAAIRRSLRQSLGSVSAAARLLGTTRRILRYKMDKLGIQSLSEEDGDDPPPPDNGQET